MRALGLPMTTLVVDRCRRLLVRAAAGLLLTLVADAAAEDASRLRLELREDRLTLHARDVPLERVLAQFVDRLGIEVRGHPAESRAVQADFDAVPVSEALTRLLDRESFTLTYAASGALRSIGLHGRLREAVATAQPPQPVGAAGVDHTRQPVVPVQPGSGGFLAGATPEQQVANRAGASRTMLDAMMQNEAFLERLRANTGEGPEEFLARLSASASSEDVRAGAAGALEDLQRRQAGELPPSGSHAAEGPPAFSRTGVQGRDRHRRRRNESKGPAAAPTR